MRQYHEQAERRIPELKGTFTFAAADAESQKQLGSHLKVAMERFQQLSGEIQALTDQLKGGIEGQVTGAEKPLSLAVTLGPDGKVLGVQRLADMPAG